MKSRLFVSVFLFVLLSLVAAYAQPAIVTISPDVPKELRGDPQTVTKLQTGEIEKIVLEIEQHPGKFSFSFPAVMEETVFKYKTISFTDGKWKSADWIRRDVSPSHYRTLSLWLCATIIILGILAIRLLFFKKKQEIDRRVRTI
jgi:hypothetical protein